MDTQDTTTNGALTPPASAKRPKAFKKWLPVSALVLVIVVIGGSYGGFRWYRHHQAAQREQKYQAVVSQLTTLNTQGKSKDVIPVAEKYLAGKPEPKYQARPRYFLALAHMGMAQMDKAKPELEQLARDPNLPRTDKPAVLSALILIGQSKKDTSAEAEQHLVDMIALLDENAKLPEYRKNAGYFVFEKQRYQMVLSSLRKQRQGQ